MDKETKNKLVIAGLAILAIVVGAWSLVYYNVIGRILAYLRRKKIFTSEKDVGPATITTTVTVDGSMADLKFDGIINESDKQLMQIVIGWKPDALTDEALSVIYDGPQTQGITFTSAYQMAVGSGTIYAVYLQEANATEAMPMYCTVEKIALVTV